jgi:hypothetical protein
MEGVVGSVGPTSVGVSTKVVYVTNCSSSLDMLIDICRFFSRLPVFRARKFLLNT